MFIRTFELLNIKMILFFNSGDSGDSGGGGGVGGHSGNPNKVTSLGLGL